MRVIILIALWASVALGAPPTTVPTVDLDRYMGLWFVIASYPEKEHADCHGLRAIYRRTSDGFDILDLCHKGGPDGPPDLLKGSATTTATPGQYKATFYLVFTADYWVLDLDPAYGWVVVGEPSREHLWIMSRVPWLADDVRSGILTRLKAQGYDPARLVEMPQGKAR